MNVNSALNTAFSGLQTSQANIAKNAQDIASLGTNKSSDVNLTESLVDLKVNQRSFEANAKVISTVDDTIGSLLNVIA